MVAPEGTERARLGVEGLHALLGARDVTPPRGLFGEPGWYRERMEAISGAVWRHELTDEEASTLVAYEHALLFLKMAQRELWKRPRRGTGRRRSKRVVFRSRGARCERCAGRLQPFSGWCIPCWRPGRKKGRKR